MSQRISFRSLYKLFIWLPHSTAEKNKWRVPDFCDFNMHEKTSLLQMLLRSCLSWRLCCQDHRLALRCRGIVWERCCSMLLLASSYGDCSLRVSCPILLNFSFVLMPGWNLRDLVAAICNVVFGYHSHFVVFVCQFIWCFMCLQHFWWLPFEAPVLCLFIKLILVGHWGHFYFGFLPLCFSCVFSDKGRISPEFEPVAH